MRAGGVTDDRREVDERVGALERGRAGSCVAHVALDYPRPSPLEVGGDGALAVLQQIEHHHLVAGGEQPPDHHRADVAGAAGDDRSHASLQLGRHGVDLGMRLARAVELHHAVVGAQDASAGRDHQHVARLAPREGSESLTCSSVGT